jgi:transcriptional regulator with XRE-family HTH domain
MAFGSAIRERRIAQGIGLNNFAGRLGISAAYWSRVEREEEKPPRDELVERAAAILGVRVDDLFVEAGRLPPDMRRELKDVVQLYRKQRQIRG